MKFSFPSHRLEDFENKVAFLNKKAAKFNQPEITFNITHKRQDKFESEETLESFYYTRVFVEIDGSGPKFGNFTVIASMVYDQGLPYFFPFKEGTENTFHGTDCEHCNQSRNRKYLYLVEDKEGSIKQVGATCLNDYVGYDILNYVSSLSALEEFREKEERPSRDNRLNVEKFLAHCIDHIKFEGYQNTKSEFSTKTKAYVAYEKLAASTESLDEARETIKFLTTEYEATDDFGHNIVNSASVEFIDFKFTGVLAYAYVAYKKELEYRERKKAAQELAEKSSHFGELKKRYTKELTHVRSIGFDSHFGYTFFHVFRDSEENTYVWKTQKANFEFEGKTVNAKFTIKDHTYYEGAAQTMVTRLNILAA